MFVAENMLLLLVISLTDKSIDKIILSVFVIICIEVSVKVIYIGKGGGGGGDIQHGCFWWMLRFDTKIYVWNTGPTLAEY